MRIDVTSYGTTKSGRPVHLYRLGNAAGMEVEVLDYGATVASIKVPDRAGKMADVVLGYDTLAEWEDGTSYFGAVVGRYGNRIAKGRFTLDGKSYQLSVNNAPNSLHGGPAGFHRQVWSAEAVEDSEGASALKLRYLSPDDEEGYPGALTAEVTYALGDGNSLEIAYRLTTDAPTVANLTNHAYFNLAGEGEGTILDHEMRIDAGRYAVTDPTLIPTGEMPCVEGTPMDFRKPATIGARIDAPYQPLVDADGYDHTYVLDGSGLRPAAEAYDPASGRVLEVLTTEPGVQLYSGNFLADEPGKNGHIYPRRGGFCFETQHLPDSPNQPHFPSTVLRPGEVYTSKTIFRFSTR